MQSLIDKIERDNPLSTDMEENWRYVWPRRWALLNAMVENFNSTQQLKAEICRCEPVYSKVAIHRLIKMGYPFCPRCGGKLSAV